MADKSRDLQFRVLSDLSKLDLDKGAREFDQLGDAGKAALDKLDDGVDRAGKNLRDYADDARDAARKIKGAFDDIADASRKSTDDVDDDLDDAKRGLDDFKDEAAGSGREAAASFGGGFDDITGFVQETAANAFSGFGPLGAAAGVAAAIGIGVITKAFGDAKESAEEARQSVSDWVQAFVDGLGEIQEATIQSKLQEFAQDGAKQLTEYSQAARDAGVSVTDFVRAKAGDLKAVERLKAQYAAASAEVAKAIPTNERNAASLAKQRAALSNVAQELGITVRQTNQARNAWETLDEATRAGITASVTLDIPSPKELDAINRRVRDGIGEIPVQLRVVGESRFTNNANNSRYRY